MNTSPIQATYRVLFALAMLSLAQPSFAQQKTASPPQQAGSTQPSIVPAPAPAAAVEPAAAVPPAPAAAADTSATPATVTSADNGRSLKSTGVALRELSPWSMFLSADILVKAVMIGLAFASLV
ncbi:MAG: tonB-system energizer ExbB, partial [Bradyrhizobium sp.]